MPAFEALMQHYLCAGETPIVTTVPSTNHVGPDAPVRAGEPSRLGGWIENHSKTRTDIARRGGVDTRPYVSSAATAPGPRDRQANRGAEGVASSDWPEFPSTRLPWPSPVAGPALSLPGRGDSRPQCRAARRGSPPPTCC